MATYTTNYLLTQPTAGASQKQYNNHRRLFVDSTGRYWYLAELADAGEPLNAPIISLDVYWADDPNGVWTKETIATDSDFGTLAGWSTNACFAEAENGDITILIVANGTIWTAGDSWQVFRRTGDDGAPAWTQQASPTPAYTVITTALIATNFTLLNHPDDTDAWIIIYGDKDPGDSNPTDLSYIRSDDNMVTWDSPVVLDAGVGNHDGMVERGGLCVATGNDKRTLYIFYNDSPAGPTVNLNFARLTAWDTSPAFSTPQVVSSGADIAPFYAVSGAWKADGNTFDLLYLKYNGTFANYYVKHREISNVDGTIGIGAETQIVYTGHQQAGPFGAYVDENDEYHFWWQDVPSVGYSHHEGEAAESMVTGSQTIYGMSTANNLALDRDLAGTAPYGAATLGTFMVGYGLKPDGVTQAYSIITSSTLELSPPLTTLPPTTPVPTTAVPPTDPPYTGPPTSPPTTLGGTTMVPTTPAPVPGLIVASYSFRRGLRQLVVRATTADSDNVLTEDDLDVEACTAELFDDSGSLGSVVGEADLAGDDYVRFVIPDVDKAAGTSYVLRLTIWRAGSILVGTRLFPLGTT